MTQHQNFKATAFILKVGKVFYADTLKQRKWREDFRSEGEETRCEGVSFANSKWSHFVRGVERSARMIGAKSNGVASHLTITRPRMIGILVSFVSSSPTHPTGLMPSSSRLKTVFRQFCGTFRRRRGRNTLLQYIFKTSSDMQVWKQWERSSNFWNLRGGASHQNESRHEKPPIAHLSPSSAWFPLFRFWASCFVKSVRETAIYLLALERL
jgi:hypothetical protein